MRNIVWWFHLWGLFIKMNVKGYINYFKWSYVAVYILTIFGYLGGYFSIWAIMQVFKEIDGWSFHEVAFIYAIDVLAYSMAQIFTYSFWSFDNMIITGSLDEYLVRPLNPLMHYMAKGNVVVMYLAQLTFGMVVLISAINRLAISWNFVTVMTFLFSLIGSVLIIASLTIIPACLAFWTEKSGQLTSLLIFDIRDFIRYPVSIYAKPIRLFLTVIVPFAFVNYYPAIFILEKNTGSTTGFLSRLTPLIGLALILLSVYIWKMGLKRYNSCGSR